MHWRFRLVDKLTVNYCLSMHWRFLVDKPPMQVSSKLTDPGQTLDKLTDLGLDIGGLD